MIHRTARLACVLTVLLAPSFAAAAAANEPPPNVVIFLADDLGWGDLGCYGHPRIQTPHLDAFAKQGLRLTQCYSACAVCSPSRSAILTGRTPYRNGVFRWIPAGSEVHLRTSEIALPKLLKAHGYDTCHTGKWHLNGLFNNPRHPQPNDHGYDHWLATQNNAAPHHLNPTNFVRNGEPCGRIEGASAVIVVDEALRWLEQRADKTRPFFLTVWTHEPHLPIESSPEFMQPYSDLNDANLRQHHGNITQLDFAFGKLLKGLDQLGHADRTLVVFTSDNGPEGNGNDGRTRGSTGGLRGRKRHSHEGGIRVPGIIRWPGHVAPGSEAATPVIGADLFNTVLAAAGVEPPQDRVLDGADITPLFAGRPFERPQPLYWRNHLAPVNSRVALRVGDWKIIAADDLSHFELYNIADDWQEKTNLAEREPAKFAELKALLIEHDRAVLAEGPDWWRRDMQPRRAQ